VSTILSKNFPDRTLALYVKMAYMMD